MVAPVPWARHKVKKAAGSLIARASMHACTCVHAGDSCFPYLNDLVASIRGVRRSPLAAAVEIVRKQVRRRQEAVGTQGRVPRIVSNIGEACAEARPKNCWQSGKRRGCSVDE